ncbi:nucleoid-associated protein YejK [Vibrio cincinnatiensis]|uniref:nucleoid-associated protein YejK n=1 Tax=Vibrio cincinnatiensis TaxID=675 RepID=UPI001EDD7ECD|nr:nucleoid-associated protein YejK [Vibrio cincinnatiensis]MCG3743122.1 nucleoid-associated protein YejK [Vibrio cincinnatiensis]
MSLRINEIAIHQLAKNEQEELIVTFGLPEPQIQPNHEAVVEMLHRTFSNKTKGYGVFNSDSSFMQLLVDFRNGQSEFGQFSGSGAVMLKNELSKYPFADEGALIFAQYQWLATEYLFIGLVPQSNGMKLMENLSISATAYMDIAKMGIAAVIDLSTLEAGQGPNRYISFIKGRAGRRVSEFFLDFLQAEIGYDAKQQNQILLQAINDFCSDQNLERDESTQLKKQAFDYCNDQIKSGEEVSVSELSGELPPNINGMSFLGFTQEQGYEIERSFPGDSATIKKLKKFVGSGGGLNITFEQILLGERVFYDPETDTLTIKGTPPNLRDQLARNN